MADHSSLPIIRLDVFLLNLLNMYISRPVAGLCLPFYTYFDCNCPAPLCQASGVFSIGCAVLFFKFSLLSGFCFVSQAIFVLFF